MNVIKAMQRIKSICLVIVIMTAHGYIPLALSQSADADPFIGINRHLYAFNNAFDEVLVKPVTRGYDAVMPGFAKRGVSNFVNNIDDVNVVFNDLLQLKIRNALHDSSRLIVNSTIGVVGFVDVAGNIGLHKNNEDFGQSLGYWGVPSGPYIVLPLLGNSTLRDAIGYIPNYLMNPIFWLDDEASRHTLYALDTIDTRLRLLAAEAMISGDEYIFVRDAFLQRRAYLVADGEVYDEWDDF